ncbi:MAG: carotenoid biosynthesis protein [Candidatus Rokubacteria bacterium]|nr:carotenoid biosynthesis protein [Candidatus Rokubacteria bacterium]
MSEVVAIGTLVWGTVSLRPYVVVLLAAFLVLAVRDVGGRKAAAFLVWGWAVAFAAEYASTRVGLPFGLYHYTGATVGRELYLSNIPLFDSLSFPVLAYASWCLARWASGRAGGAAAVGLSGIVMMLLDVVIDPLAVRGERWFLGYIFFYPDGGAYFGVPLSNFFGWTIVGWVIVAGYVRVAAGSTPLRGSVRLGAGLYYGVFLFGWILTVWIGQPLLAATGFLIHGALFLVLWGGFAGRAVALADAGGHWRGSSGPREPEGATSTS